MDPEMAAQAAAVAAHGWVNLLADPSLADWQRIPLPRETPLDPRNPWRYDAETGLLHCDGVGLHELLAHHTPRRDGILRVEWRFTGESAKPNAGVWVRTTPDLSSFHAAQLAPGGIGPLSGGRPGPTGGTRRLNTGARRPDLLRKSGEWNVVEIACIGSRLTLHLNGVVTADWNECKTPEGLLGLEVDGTGVEFRAVKFRPLR
jgi:hypothetical protein